MTEITQTAFYSEISSLISEVTGTELERITLESKLELDLAVDMTKEFPRIIGLINQTYDIQLDINLFFEEYEEPTVQDLVLFTSEEEALS